MNLFTLRQSFFDYVSICELSRLTPILKSELGDHADNHLYVADL